MLVKFASLSVVILYIVYINKIVVVADSEPASIWAKAHCFGPFRRPFNCSYFHKILQAISNRQVPVIMRNGNLTIQRVHRNSPRLLIR